MKIRTATLALLAGLIFNQNLFGVPLDNWHWRNPLPNGNPQAGPHAMKGVVFANGQFVAVGAGGVASISSDSTNWVENATATTNNLNGLAYLNGRLVAVGDNGTVETSTDGLNWSLQASGTTNSLVAVAFANGSYVAVGANVVITSTDAVNWSSAVSGLSGATGVAGGSAGFVAVGGAGSIYPGTSNLVFFSSNGSTWTSQVLTAPGSYFFGASLQNSIVTYFNGAYFIGSSRYATSQSADRFIFSSSDGTMWSTNVLGNVSTSFLGFNYKFFMSGNGFEIAAGTAGGFPFLQFSADGINWATTNNVPTADIQAQGTAGAYGNGHYVIVAPANVSYTLPPIFTSTDGMIWTDQQRPPTPPAGPTNVLTSIAFSNGIYVATGSNSIVRSTNGLTYVAVSNSPALSSVITYNSGFVGVGSSGKIYLSGDGLSWTQRNSGTANGLHGVASGGGLLVAVGDNGAIQTSPTGTIWTSRTSGTSLPLYGVAYASGLFVAVGQLGTVLTSPDGINWTGQDSGQLTDLFSVISGSAGFTAVGVGGVIVTSPDGINWTTQSSGVSSALKSITFGNGYYLAAGDSATVLTSLDGVTWTARNLGLTGGQNLFGSAFLNGRFAVVGSGGIVLESDVIAPLFDLQIHGAGSWLTAFAPAGSSFRIQTSPSLATPVWTDAASFNNAAAITQWTNSVPGAGQLFYRAVAP